MIRDHGAKVYCDLKFHDIPNTVSHACSNLIRHNINFLIFTFKAVQRWFLRLLKFLKKTAKSLEIDPPNNFGCCLLSSFGQRTLTEELCVESNIENYIINLG